MPRVHQVENYCIWAVSLLLVLTHLLTTALDDRGRDRTDKRGEQGRSDPVDGAGQHKSFS